LHGPKPKTKSYRGTKLKITKLKNFKLKTLVVAIFVLSLTCSSSSTPLKSHQMLTMSSSSVISPIEFHSFFVTWNEIKNHKGKTLCHLLHLLSVVWVLFEAHSFRFHVFLMMFKFILWWIILLFLVYSLIKSTQHQCLIVLNSFVSNLMFWITESIQRHMNRIIRGLWLPMKWFTTFWVVSLLNQFMFVWIVSWFLPDLH